MKSKKYLLAIIIVIAVFLFKCIIDKKDNNEILLGDSNILGDINGDGKVNSLDYILIRKSIMKTSTFNSSQKINADVNEDGKITSADYIAIRMAIINGKIIGYVKSTPVTYKITFNPNGGIVDVSSKNIKKGESYGSLPIPTRRGYRFIGWFTSKDNTFNAKYYSDAYSDLKKAFGVDYNSLLQHWLDYGFKEGRQCSSTYRNHFNNYNNDNDETLYAAWIRNDKKTNLENINNAIGICYSTGFNPVIDSIVSPPLVVGKDNINAGYIYYWGKPALGFYRSDDKEIIKKHMLMFNEAAIDFIIIDNTNAQIGWKNQYSWFGKPESKTSYYEEMVYKSEKALLDTLREMTDNGIRTPKVVNWINNTNNNFSVLNELKKDFYDNADYQDLWLYYGEKPLILTTAPSTSNSNFTMRKMWGLESNRTENAWSFLEPSNKPSNNNEQISVSVAIQTSYMSDEKVYCRNNGETFYNQWKNAFASKSKVVTITWWNEWVVIALNVNGQVKFTDNYNPECSRDIEPMEGGHGDKYYKLMKLLILDYKNNKSIRPLSEYQRESGLIK